MGRYRSSGCNRIGCPGRARATALELLRKIHVLGSGNGIDFRRDHAVVHPQGPVDSRLSRLARKGVAHLGSFLGIQIPPDSLPKLGFDQSQALKGKCVHRICNELGSEIGGGVIQKDKAFAEVVFGEFRRVALPIRELDGFGIRRLAGNRKGVASNSRSPSQLASLLETRLHLSRCPFTPRRRKKE